MCLRDGLLFASDSRTNAGVDYVTSYSKMHLFTQAADRLFVLLSAGNLATTQEVINHIQRDLDFPEGRENLLSARYLFEAADYVGRVSQHVQKQHSQALQQAGVSGDVTLILGGQIKGGPSRLFLIYPEGNFIEAGEDTPFFQIGETKYGRPILVRAFDPDMSFSETVKLLLVSFDSTIKAISSSRGGIS